MGRMAATGLRCGVSVVSRALHSQPGGWVDTHCHLDAILKRSKLSLSSYGSFAADCYPPRFDGCVTVACSVRSFDPTKRLIDDHEKCFAAFGIHPHYADTEVENTIRAYHSHPKVVAWGECGLDYYRNLVPEKLQRSVFVQQLKSAVHLGKPVVVHTRDARTDTLAIMKDELPAGWKVHVHCFTGEASEACDLLNNFRNLMVGFSSKPVSLHIDALVSLQDVLLFEQVGFTGVITFRSARRVRQAVATVMNNHDVEVDHQVPLSRLLLETDGPYMAPEPFRGQVAHPGHVPIIAQAVADIKGVEVGRVLEACRHNTRFMYSI